jgi:hypothetical protein
MWFAERGCATDSNALGQIRFGDPPLFAARDSDEALNKD